MPETVTRRGILGQAAAAPLAGVVATPSLALAAQPADPHPAWLQEALAKVAWIDASTDEEDPDEEKALQMHAAYTELLERILVTPARTIAGAAAQVRAAAHIYDNGCEIDSGMLRLALHTLDCHAVRA